MAVPPLRSDAAAPSGRHLDCARRELLRPRAKVPSGSDPAQFAAVDLAAPAVVLDDRVLADAIGVVVIAAVQVASVRRPVPAIKVLGAQQMLLGLVLVVVTAVGVLVS